MPTPVTLDDWLTCLNQPEYLQMIPSGCIRPIVGPIIWIDGNGTKLTHDEYVEKWGIDPQVAWDAVKEYRKMNRGDNK